MFPEFRPGTVGSNGRTWYELSVETENAQLALLGIFMQAIATFEGFYKEGSLAQRNNNPGNLRPIGASQGFRVFPSANDGWIALRHQVLLNINRGLTLNEFFLGKEGVYPGYAPLGDNEPEVMENYISYVATRTSMSRVLDLRWYFPVFSDLEGTNIPIQGIALAYKLLEVG